MHVVERATEKITTFLNGNDIKINRSGRVNDLISVMEIVLGDDMVSLIITEYGKCSIELDYFYHYMNGSQGEHPAIRLEFHDIIVDDVSFINMFDKTLYIVSKTIKKFKEELYFVIGEGWVANKEISELGVLISDTQDLLKQVPGDTIVEFQLEQLKHRQSELNNELRALSIYNDLKSMMKEEEE